MPSRKRRRTDSELRISKLEGREGDERRVLLEEVQVAPLSGEELGFLFFKRVHCAVKNFEFGSGGVVW